MFNSSSLVTADILSVSFKLRGKEERSLTGGRQARKEATHIRFSPETSSFQFLLLVICCCWKNAKNMAERKTQSNSYFFGQFRGRNERRVSALVEAAIRKGRISDYPLSISVIRQFPSTATLSAHNAHMHTTHTIYIHQGTH